MRAETPTWSREKKELYCFADSLPLCRQLLDAGARIIQLRAKNLDDHAFKKLALEMQALMREHPAPTSFIVNDRVEIGLEIGADGLHVGQDDADYRQVIAAAPAGMIVGVSVKTTAQALDAEKSGASYVGAGSIYPTTTKDDAELIGLATLQEIVAATSVPVVAIGGISLENIGEVARYGAHYFAVISALNQAPDIAARFSDLQLAIVGENS